MLNVLIGRTPETSERFREFKDLLALVREGDWVGAGSKLSKAPDVRSEQIKLLKILGFGLQVMLAPTRPSSAWGAMNVGDNESIGKVLFFQKHYTDMIYEIISNFRPIECARILLAIPDTDTKIIQKMKKRSGEMEWEEEKEAILLGWEKQKRLRDLIKDIIGSALKVDDEHYDFKRDLLDCLSFERDNLKAAEFLSEITGINSSLEACSARENNKMVKILIPKASGVQIWECLELSILRKNDEIVRFILDGKHVDAYSFFRKAPERASVHWILTEKLLKDEGFDPTTKNNQIIMLACKYGEKRSVELLLKDERVDPTDQNGMAIIYAIEGGGSGVVGLLLKDGRLDPSTLGNEAIVLASKKGRADVVELLLQDGRADPSARRNEAIVVASKMGHADVVRALLQDGRADPSARENEAIVLASKMGHADVVRALLQDGRASPSARENEAIVLAIENDKYDVVKLLLGDYRVDPSDGENRALKVATELRYSRIARILLERDEVKAKISEDGPMEYFKMACMRKDSEDPVFADILFTNLKDIPVELFDRMDDMVRRTYPQNDQWYDLVNRIFRYKFRRLNPKQ